MKKSISILAALIMATGTTACSRAAAEQNPAASTVTGMEAETTAETAASTANKKEANTEIDRDHAEKLRDWLDFVYTRSLNDMSNLLEKSITQALEKIENPKKLDGEYHGTLPDEILEIMRPICSWYDDKTVMTDFAARITNGEVSALWTERNVHEDLQERLKKLKESNRNWETEYCEEGELWSYLGFADYDAYISVIDNWETTTYYGSYPKPTVSRYESAANEFSVYSDTKPDFEKIAS